VYAVRGKGARFWDVDGHEYIDWASGIGAILLGYCDPVVDDAVRQQIGQGINFSVNHPLELELADELCHRVPCAEMVRYTKSGGEACAVAVRIARGATGREIVLFCGYHGWHDWYLAANLEQGAHLDAHLFPGIEPIGIPKALAGTAMPFPYGDAAALGELLDRHKGQVAAVIMEPLRSRQPPEGYLPEVARLCRDSGVLLVFDEISTGFRYHRRAAQSYVGVTPDMALFAKSISNGYPLGVVAGRRDVMQAAGHMFISSTYWSDAIGLRAALTTLSELDRRNVPARLWSFGSRLQDGINTVARETGLAVRCEGLNIAPQLVFEAPDPQTRTKLATLYIQEMAKRGCHGYAAFSLNAAQGEVELNQTLAAARETFSLLQGGLEKGALDALLECELRSEPFQRLVT
jgi:glutamate-1-semialdehyde 2,1-aminomutase